MCALLIRRFGDYKSALEGYVSLTEQLWERPIPPPQLDCVYLEVRVSAGAPGPVRKAPCHHRDASKFAVSLPRAALVAQASSHPAASVGQSLPPPIRKNWSQFKHRSGPDVWSERLIDSLCASIHPNNSLIISKCVSHYPRS